MQYLLFCHGSNIMRKRLNVTFNVNCLYKSRYVKCTTEIVLNAINNKWKYLSTVKQNTIRCPKFITASPPSSDRDWSPNSLNMSKDIKTACHTEGTGNPTKSWLFLVLQLHLQRGTFLQRWDQSNKESKTLANSLTCNIRVQYFEVKFEEVDSK